MESIVMTGATGALGSDLLPILLRERFKVYCLTRANGPQSPQERIDRITGGSSDAIAVRGDITQSGCGINEADLRFLRGSSIKRILHGAASIAFSDPKATYAANVGGVSHVLDLADTLEISHIDHVSTVYVAGSAETLSESDVAFRANYHQPRNDYEKTKQVGEGLVRAWARRGGGRRFNIYRLAILIARTDGTTTGFEAFYRYIEAIHRTAEAMRQHSRQQKELPPGVLVIGEDVKIPLVIRISKLATLNVVQMDWVSKIMLELMSLQGVHNTVYHLVHPNPPNVSWLLQESLKCLQVRGVSVVESEVEKKNAISGQSPLFRKLQRRMDATLGQFGPYTNGEFQALMGNVQRDLGPRYHEPAALDQEFVSRMIEFAVRNDWGKKSVA